MELQFEWFRFYRYRICCIIYNHNYRWRCTTANCFVQYKRFAKCEWDNLFKVICMGASGSSGTLAFGTGNVNSLSIAGTVASASVSAPTTITHDLTFRSVSTGGMTVNWTNGNGSKRVVIMNTTNTFTTPSDASDPGANTVYEGSDQQV